MKDETPTTVAHVKRFLERLRADSSFREEFLKDPEMTVKNHNIQVDPEEIRPLWDKDLAAKLEVYKEEFKQEPEVSDSVKAYQQFIREKLDQRKTILKDAEPAEEHFKAWRARQIARLSSQVYPGEEPDNVHIPVCFELSKGCSVGCWFCGLDPLPLSGIFEYTEENAQLWKACLEVTKEIIGPAAGRGFCYWATEPFDNPDYEKFCLDFYHILGRFPQTTTALPLKDPARTRSLLRLSEEMKGSVNRFSVLSRDLFNKIHEEFSAEELLWVELITQNQDADLIKCKSGRFRNACEKNPEIWKKEMDKLKRTLIKASLKEESLDDLLERRTTACVTGFLVNMVDKQVKLISPCIPDAEYLLGFMICDEGLFSNADEFDRLLRDMIDRNMALTLLETIPIKFRDDLVYESLPDGFQLSTKVKTFTCRNQQHDSYLKELGALIHKGENTIHEISLLCRYRHGVSEVDTFVNISKFSSQGLLCEDIRKEKNRSDVIRKT